MQLVAYGAQDVFLTGTPEITFWKVSYRRHTNFAMESIEQTFSGQADFGRRVTCTISRNGDLAYRTYLQVTLPEINQGMKGSSGDVYARWLDFPGEQLIAQVEVEIGGQRIDRQYGDWMHIWNQLTMTSEKLKGYYKMIGHTSQLTYITDPTFANVSGPCAASGGPAQVCAPRHALPETTLYVPLQFWFNKNPGLALPLIALQYHEVKININFESETNCRLVAATTTAIPFTASLWVDYIFLDTDERRRFAQLSHEYLIEQLQFTGEEAVASANIKSKLNFNHPCKELVWFLTNSDNNNANWFNYTTCVNKVSTSDASTDILNANLAYDGLTGNDIEVVYPSNPVTSAKLVLNGNDRFSYRDGLYFNIVQPYQHHENTPKNAGINVYSFALNLFSNFKYARRLS